MSEHLTLERLSAVVDEPHSDPSAVAHLGACDACQRDYESLTRMRMALSGLPELDPPPEVWDAIEQQLPSAPHETGVVSVRRRRIRGWEVVSGWPLRVAAAAVLFVGGLFVGERLREAGLGPEAASRTDGQPPAGEVAIEDGATVGATDREGAAARSPAFGAEAMTYVAARQNLEALRGRFTTGGVDFAQDPAAAAARLAELNALVEASREALREAPEDPAVNDFLFEVIDERDALSDNLNRVLHAATLEYR